MNAPNSDFEYVPCNLCGSEDYETLFIAKDWFFQLPGEFPVAKCKNCSLVYLNPRVTCEAIIGYYPKNYYTHFSLNANEPSIDVCAISFLKTRERIKSLISEYYRGLISKPKRIIVFLILLFFWKRIHTRNRWSLIGESGRLLDIGCGNGSYLHRISQDWLVGKKIDCFGIEPDKKAVEYALASRLKVTEGTLETVSFPDDYFDIVRINHTLEHIPDPFGTLKEVHRITKPGGKVIIEVPNFNSVGRKLLNDKWAGIDAPRHYFQFTPATLKRMLVVSGFQPLRVTRWRGMHERKLSLEWINKYWDSIKLRGQKRRIKSIELSILLWLLDNFYKGGTFSIKAIKV